ncbi:hypothetical protein [Microlunatus soli]|uniref:DUF2269 family protein n=1 Tax=Microlunatus soli TaxID=630515 RepID=A0A1H1MG46_9ACTN|nr:hypothetical protein [Microlunatus soli]SDR85630.1 hypothetical protein SAMN04489812_0120 [Microlunatus soli]
MFKIFLALHLIFAVGAIGPLLHAATTAVRGVRTADAVATAAGSRMIKIYAIGSVLVVIFGFGLLSMDSPYDGKPVGSFTDTWVWLSLLLWLIGVGLAWGVVSTGLDKATSLIKNGESPNSVRGRVAAAGGVVGLIFVVIIVLMVFRP